MAPRGFTQNSSPQFSRGSCRPTATWRGDACGLYKLYAKQAAATANPYTLQAVQHGLTLEGLFAHEPQRAPLQPPEVAAMPVTMYAARSRSDSPPRATSTSCRRARRRPALGHHALAGQSWRRAAPRAVLVVGTLV